MHIWPRKKKKEPKKGSIEELNALLGSLSKTLIPKDKPMIDCPEVLIATNSCVCIKCPNKDTGKCSLEAMSRSSGCVHCFPSYCSLLDSKKTNPTYGFGESITKEWAEAVKHRLGLSGEVIAKPIEIPVEKEKLDVKKKGKSNNGIELSGGHDESTE